jgi:hypothetical protein
MWRVEVFMPIKIESGIPMPAKFPFAEMKVNDSFLVPESTSKNVVGVYARRHAIKTGMKFTVRKTPEGYRCWRIE